LLYWFTTRALGWPRDHQGNVHVHLPFPCVAPLTQPDSDSDCDSARPVYYAQAAVLGCGGGGVTKPSRRALSTHPILSGFVFSFFLSDQLPLLCSLVHPNFVSSLALKNFSFHDLWSFPSFSHTRNRAYRLRNWITTGHTPFSAHTIFSLLPLSDCVRYGSKQPSSFNTLSTCQKYKGISFKSFEKPPSLQSLIQR
jgi:hypothetical protein